MIEKIKAYKEYLDKWWENLSTPRRIRAAVTGTGLIVLVVLYCVSRTSEKEVHVFHNKDHVNFEGGRIIGSTDSIYKRKEAQFSKTLKDLEAKNSELAAKIESILLNQKAISEKLNSAQTAPTPSPAMREQPSSTREQQNGTPTQESPTEIYPTSQVPGSNQMPMGGSNKALSPSVGRSVVAARGPQIISFPVKEIDSAEMSVVIPSGSYVKSRAMTGVEAPEGKNYPVLLQLDYAFIGPNRTKIDLTGCFGIAKAQGDLATERVQMQLTKISCVSQKGRMFEREVNGFVADDKDNSFALMGSVNSKQDRVAGMAFLSSVVEGIGKAIQQAQTSQQTNAMGGTQTMVTGDQGRYIGAGGVANAASMVTQWYLEQAKNLLPTINIGSGHELWIVVQDKVDLPNWYFQKTNAAEQSVYSYITKTLD